SPKRIDSSYSTCGAPEMRRRLKGGKPVKTHFPSSLLHVFRRNKPPQSAAPDTLPRGIALPTGTEQASFQERFWSEFFGNSAHFPVANFLFEILVEGVMYLRAPDLYILLLGSLVQSYWLTRWQTTAAPRRFWGNLIGVAVYSIIEVLWEGAEFFLNPNHLAYWFFSLGIGILQTLQTRLPRRFLAPLIVSESIFRTSILFVMYALFEFYANPAQTRSLNAFFADTSHQFIALVVLFVGLILGLAHWTLERYWHLLSEARVQLARYSEWLLGHDLLTHAMRDPTILEQARRERTVLFMDIRGFTAWSETQPPESVAKLLNQYYQLSENILSVYDTLKFKFSADEVMGIFPTPHIALRAVMALHAQRRECLMPFGLGVGIGIHTGVLVEGLVGSANVKFFDVVGDTVNTAKRIESAATAPVIAPREISIKGKSSPLQVWSVQIDPASPLTGVREQPDARVANTAESLHPGASHAVVYPSAPTSADAYFKKSATQTVVNARVCGARTRPPRCICRE